MLQPYINTDQEKLVEILNLNIPKYFAPEEVIDFIHYLEIKGDTYFTIKNENEIIGGVGYAVRNDDKSGRINWIFLHPEFSKIGKGRKAAEECLMILKSNPTVEFLKVRTSQFVYEFFEKLGFKITHTKKDYWAKGFDLYEMEMAK